VNVLACAADCSAVGERPCYLDQALELQVDWIALSFVQRPEDVAEARQIVAGRAGVLAKLEKPAGHPISLTLLSSRRMP